MVLPKQKFSYNVNVTDFTFSISMKIIRPGKSDVVPMVDTNSSGYDGVGQHMELRWQFPHVYAVNAVADYSIVGQGWDKQKICIDTLV